MDQFWLGFTSGLTSLGLIWLLFFLIRRNKESHLNIVLAPLKERIDLYQKLLTEQRERSVKQDEALQQTITNLISSHKSIEESTKDLYRALRGDSKVQGDWGEVILERILESSGLSKNIEYSLQGKGMGLRGEEGKLLKPDAIIHLPEDKHIIVDSKLSLSFSFSEDIDKLRRSLQQHIDELSAKTYQKIDKLSSPDFVIMFIPIESVISTIYTELPELIPYAQKKNIVLASPLSLLPILQSIASLWRLSKQNENSVEIARQAGLLYDRFVSFVDDLDKIKKSISRLSDDFEQVDRRLHIGKDNLVERSRKLKELGAKTSKEL